MSEQQRDKDRSQRRTWAELWEAALRDESVRRALIDDPRSAIRTYIGVDLPEDVPIQVFTVPEDALYFVLPVPTQEPRAKAPLGGPRLPETARIANTFGGGCCEGYTSCGPGYTWT